MELSYELIFLYIYWTLFSENTMWYNYIEYIMEYSYEFFVPTELFFSKNWCDKYIKYTWIMFLCVFTFFLVKRRYVIWSEKLFFYYTKGYMINCAYGISNNTDCVSRIQQSEIYEKIQKNCCKY